MAQKDLIPFKKGFNPNRNITGMNRGSKWLTTKLEDALTALSDDKKTRYDELLVRRVLRKAIVEGDMRAIEHIWDRTEGKATQSLDVTTKGETFKPSAPALVIVLQFEEKLKGELQ
jgi:hypothetical protein